MMKADQSWIYQQEPAQHSPSSIHMSSILPYAKPSSFASCINPCVPTSNLLFPGFPISALPKLRTVQANGGHEVSPCLPSLEKSSLPISDTYLREFQPSFAHQVGINPTPNDFTGYTQKSFMIFDQSRDQTQMFFSPPIPSSRNHFIDTLNFPFACQLFGKPITQNLSNENHILGEESELREDTEEINALLYSDDEDCEYDDDEDDSEDDDEVTSTGQSPFSLKRSNGSKEEVEDNSEDLAAFDDGSMKRQKLLNGEYQRSLVHTGLASAELDRSCNHENDAESCCVSSSARTRKHMGSIPDRKQSRRDKIRETLKILESIIPCSNNHKDPLLIIDEAINHLKSLKTKAKALGVC